MGGGSTGDVCKSTLLLLSLLVLLLVVVLITQDEKEDPSMEEEGAHWNEMRAVLNKDNMVSCPTVLWSTSKPARHLKQWFYDEHWQYSVLDIIVKSIKPNSA